MKKQTTSKYKTSLSHQAWQRLKKNKLALFAMFIIGTATLVAQLGYLITPDATPDANGQLLELCVKPPGFKIKMLQVRKNEISHKSNFFNKMLFGEESDYRSIPIVSYHFMADSIVVEEYTGSNPNNGNEIKFNLADVVYPINTNRSILLNSKTGVITFYPYNNTEAQTTTIAALHKTIIQNNIIVKQYFLGTDRAGRDMLSRMLIGTRVSLAVGFISVFISIIIGVLMGAIAGFFRGGIDILVMWFINVVWAIPTLLLVIAITLLLGKGFWQVFIAIGLTMWVEVARVTRGQVLSLREKEFVEAGRALGFKNIRILFKHVIPNAMGPVIVISSANFAAAILIEAGLSFLGIGAQSPTASWGSMINAHRGYILVDAAYLAIIPGIAIMLLVLAFVLLGNGLRDALEKTQ